MKYRKLGQTDLEVSLLGFGGFQLPMMPKSDAIRLIQDALDNDINLYETARDYRNSEELIGTALKKNRDEVIYASKMGAKFPKDPWKRLNKSLQKLQTDRIDVYSVQGVNSLKQLERYESSVFPEMEKMKSSGAIDYIGVTTHDLDVAVKVAGYDYVDVITTPMNIVLREPIRRLLPVLNGKGLFAVKPFGGKDFYYIQWQHEKWNRDTKDFEKIFNPGVALNYLCQFNEISSILCGFSESSQISIDEYMIKTGCSERTKRKYSFDKIPSNLCTLCGDCVCPEDIRVPFLMKLWEYYRLYDIKDWTRTAYNRLDLDYWDCTGCKTCELLCPKQISIVARMKALEKELRNDGPD